MIVGYQKIWQFLTKSAELGKLSHAYLFSGPERSEKKKLALEFAKWLFISQSKEIDLEIEKGQHPDFIFITPEKKEIKISQVREMIWRLFLKPSIRNFKVAIIDQAHCLNHEAQNCLLKTLEEPKGKAILFLITEYPERLFPTIRSRCQIIKFPLIQREESDPQRLKIQEKIISDLIKILDSDLIFRFQYIKNLTREKDQDLREILEIWQRYFREILIREINQKNFQYPLINKLKDILKLIQNTNFLISTTNINPRLALEVLMLEL